MTDYQPPPVGDNQVKDTTGTVLFEGSHAECWYWIIDSGNKSLSIYEGDILLYHQPSLVME